MKKIFKPFIAIVVIILIWYCLCSLHIWNAYVLPSPEKVLNSAIGMVKSGELLKNIVISVRRVFIGFGISFTLAFCLGILVSLYPRATPYYSHIVEFARNVPPISLIPLLILWFGIGETPKIIVIVLASFFPIFLNTKNGIQACDIKLLEVGDSLGFSDKQKFYKIMLPSAIPSILVGMRIGLGYSWRAIVGAEMIAASGGLGYIILDSQQMSRSDKVLVGIFTIGILGCFCNLIFHCIIKKISHGGVRDSWS
jgi:sulfonate transport system permease protein